VNAERMEVPQNAKTLAVSFAGYDRKKGKDALVYVAVNAYLEEVKITLPNLSNHGAWYLSVNTYGDENRKYFYHEGEAIRIAREYVMNPRSIMVFTGREL
ncbi:glycogen debranching enzyme, partial [Anaerostipes hadrus]|nr:glycogen debranching enzyme [Anaerostipes hadrus]